MKSGADIGNNAQEDPVGTRGVHRIFLGYAPGVGKTQAMLREAQRRAADGQDVVIGYFETRSRSDTFAIAQGLDRVPPMVIEHHGAQLTELDADAVIAHHPQLAVVDELAHANAPGCTRAKRWESVEDILDAGIDVISTLNVQHVESLNAFVHQVSGVRVLETVPDFVVRRADVVVVDAEPDELLARVRSGLVLPADEIGQGLTHFFRRPTLVALREKTFSFGVPVRPEATRHTRRA